MLNLLLQLLNLSLAFIAAADVGRLGIVGLREKNTRLIEYKRGCAELAKIETLLPGRQGKLAELSSWAVWWNILSQPNPIARPDAPPSIQSEKNISKLHQDASYLHHSGSEVLEPLLVVYHILLEENWFKKVKYY